MEVPPLPGIPWTKQAAADKLAWQAVHPETCPPQEEHKADLKNLR